MWLHPVIYGLLFYSSGDETDVLGGAVLAQVHTASSGRTGVRKQQAGPRVSAHGFYTLCVVSTIRVNGERGKEVTSRMLPPS